MGIKGLSKLIKQYSKVITLEELQGKRVAVDTSIYLYKFKYNTTGNMFLNSFCKQLLLFKQYNIDPVYVFEGEAPKEKEVTTNNRKEIKKQQKENLENAATEEEKQQIKKSIIDITKEDINNLMELFRCTGVEFTIAPCEGECYCVYLNKVGDVDYVLSNDLDSLTFGCKDLVTYQNGMYQHYNLDFILHQLEVSHELFIDMCIACGCDYYPQGIYRVGPMNALSLAKKNGKLEKWKKELPPNLQDIRNLFTKELNKVEHIKESPSEIKFIIFSGNSGIKFDKKFIKMMFHE